MLPERLLIIWLTTFVTTILSSPDDRINPLIENADEYQQKTIEKRQYPWHLPQEFPNLVYVPNAREGWRYYPCRSYPSFPAYPPRPSLVPSTPPSSPTDDPDDILDRMGGGEGKKKNKNEPSRCVWAVVACCSPGSRDIRYSCFELLGCPGAFWDVNPCEEKVVMAAANSALNFYSGENNETSTPT